jgi:hypothetical protein
VLASETGLVGTLAVPVVRLGRLFGRLPRPTCQGPLRGDRPSCLRRVIPRTARVLVPCPSTHRLSTSPGPTNATGRPEPCQQLHRFSSVLHGQRQHLGDRHGLEVLRHVAYVGARTSSSASRLATDLTRGRRQARSKGPPLSSSMKIETSSRAGRHAATAMRSSWCDLVPGGAVIGCSDEPC